MYKPEPQATVEDDEFYGPAVSFVRASGRVSLSYMQRHFKIGYNRAARLIEAMQSEGVLGKPKSEGGREVLPHND